MRHHKATMQKYNTYKEEQRDDTPCNRGGDTTTTTPSTPSSIQKTDIGVWGTLFSPEKSVPSCQSNYMIPDDGMTTSPITTTPGGVPSYGNTREEDNKGINHHSFGNMSKGMIRTFQTTVQNNTRSEQMMPESSPISPKLQSRLSRAAMETTRIANAVHHLAIVDGVSDKLSSVNDKLGSVMRSGTASLSSFTSRAGGGDTKLYNTSCSDSGSSGRDSIYNTPPRTRGSTVSASEVVNTSAQKVMNVFKRQNTYPVFGNGHAENTDNNIKGAKDVSFDYQLMKDNE